MTTPVPANAIALSIKAFLEERTAELRTNYERFLAYYEGDHQTRITDRMKEFLPSGMEFVDNFCAVVVDALTERLNVIGFESTIPDSPSEASTDAAQELMEEINAWVWNTWQILRMDALQQIIHTVAPMKADAYALVAWNNETEKLEITYQDPDLILPRYNNGVNEWTSKTWVQQDDLDSESVARLNIYYPDRVEKFISRGNSKTWEPFTEEDDGQFPVPWVDKAGDPLGIPLIHFRNNPHGNDFGTSELRSIIPLQDALNKALIDFVQVNDTAGFPQRFAVNVLAPAEGYQTSPGSVWHMTAEESEDRVSFEIGQFESADPERLIKSMDKLIDDIAAISRTPKHLFKTGGTNLSGEALKVAESGLVNKAENRMVGFGNSWEDVMLLAARVQNTFGSEQSPIQSSDITLNTTWDDPESRNDESFTAALIGKQAMGVPQRQLWRELGYTQEQIETMEQDKQDEIVADTNIGAAIMRNFETGGTEL